MGVHPGAVLAEQRLRHEGRVPAVLHGVLLDRDAVGHAVVRHLQRVGVAHVDLVLARPDLVVRVLHVDAELLEREHGLAAHVGAGVERGEVEVAALVEHLRHAALGARVPEVEELELGAHVEVREAHLLRALERAPQHLARVALVGLAGRASRRRRTSAPRPRPPGARAGSRRSTASGMAIMSDSSIALKPVIDEPSKPIPPSKASSSSWALIEKLFSWPEDVGEPEPHEADVAVLDEGADVVRGLRLVAHARGGYSQELAQRLSARTAGSSASPFVGEEVLDPHRRVVDHAALDDALRLQLLHPLGQQPVREVGHELLELGEARGPVHQDEQDRAGPALAHQLDGVVVLGAACLPAYDDGPLGRHDRHRTPAHGSRPARPPRRAGATPRSSRRSAPRRRG